MTYESALSAVWPAVARVARLELRRFRLQPEVVEDLVQDAAAIVMRRRPAFATSDDLAPYVRVVVRRLAYRWLQRATKEVVGVVPDKAVSVSVAELAEHRLQLRGTARAFAALPSEQRAHLREYLGATERTGDTRERARERKQIERIRMAMTRVAEGLAAAFGWVRDRLRWFDVGAPQVAGMAYAVTGLIAVLLPEMAASPAGASPVVVMSSGRPAVSLTASPPVLPPPARDVGRATSAATAGERPRASSPPPGGQSDIIGVDTPTGDRAGVRTGDNPDAVLACVRTVCVHYEDVPVSLPGDPRE